MIKLSLVLLLLLTVQSCKGQLTSGLDAFGEDTSPFASGVDRIYLAIDDYRVKKTSDILSDTVADKKLDSMLDKVRSVPNDIFSRQIADNLISIYSIQPKDKEILNGSLHVVGCFNEPKDRKACVKLPKIPVLNPSLTNYSLITLQSKPSESCGNRGIRLNERFRLSDFPIDKDRELKHYENIDDDLRTGKCVELFDRKTLLDTVNAYGELSRTLGPKSGAYIRAALSGVGCAVAAGNAFKGIQGVASKFAGKSKLASSLATAGSQYSTANPVLNAAAKSLTVASKIDDALYGILGRVKGGPLEKYGTILAGRIFSKIKAAGAASLLLGYKMAPRLGLIYGKDHESNRDMSLEQMSNHFITAAEFKGNEKYKKQIDVILESDIFKQAMSATERMGVTGEDWLYIGVAGASIFIPGLSCVLLAKDIKNISDKSAFSDNQLHLQSAIDDSRKYTMQLFDSWQKENGVDKKKQRSPYSLAGMHSFYKRYTSLFGTENTVSAVEFNLKGVDDYNKLATYYQVLNFYAAKIFNLNLAKTKFEHPGWFISNDGIGAFSSFTKQDAKAVQKLSGLLALLVVEQKVERNILSEYEALIKEVKKDGLDLKEINKSRKDLEKQL